MPGVFSGTSEAAPAAADAETEKLHAKIRELVAARDFCRSLARLGACGR